MSSGQDTTLARRRIALAGLLAWGIVVAGITLTPSSQPPSAATGVGVSCLICGSRGAADAVLNVLLFLPLGAGLVYRGRTAASAAFVGVSISCGIELFQIMLPGRYPTLGDLVWNGTGAALGVGFAVWIESLRTRSPRLGERMAAVVVPPLAVLATAVLFVPTGTSARYYGQWTAALGHLETYEGRLLTATLQGEPVPRARFPAGSDPRSVLDGPFEVRITFEKGPAPAGVAPILSIYDENRQEILLLGADGEDLVWRERRAAATMRLDVPDLRRVDVLERFAVGDTVEAVVRRDGAARCMGVVSTESCVSLPWGRGWGFFLYVEGVSENVRGWLDLAWISVLFVPIGLVNARNRDRMGDGAVGLLLTVVAVMLTPLAAQPALSWGGALAGLVVGAAIRGPRRDVVRPSKSQEAA